MTMGIEFGNPEGWYLAIGLAVAVVAIIYGSLLCRRAMRRFADSSLLARLLENHSRRRRLLKRILIVSAFMLLVLAITMPRMGRGTRIVKREGADIVVALDVSLSMLAEDVEPSRMEVAKQAVRTLISMLPDDRFALVGFAGDSFIHCPLTLDKGAIAMFLDYLEPGSVPVQGTDIGRAIETATQALKASKGRGKAIVLITDGEDHGDDLDKALEAAKSQDIKIFAVGIGTQSGEPIPIRDSQGNVIMYKKDEKDKVVVSKLNASLLKRIATEAGGESFVITASNKGVGKLARALAHVEKGLIEEQSYENYQELFQVPLVFALALLIIEAMIADGRKNA